MTNQEFTEDDIAKAEMLLFKEIGDSLEGYKEDPIYDTPNYISADRAIWGNPDASNYVKTYIVKVDFMGHKVLWHKWAVVPLQNALNEIKASGINYNWKVVQTYNNRNMRGSNRKSMHAWPLAFDVNPATNPYRTDNKLITDIPNGIIKIFKKHGFSWGGEWRTLKDSMHFEYVGAPYKKQTPTPTPEPSEDEMTSQEREMLFRIRIATVSNSFDTQIIIAMLNGDATSVKELLARKEVDLANERKRLGID